MSERHERWNERLHESMIEIYLGMALRYFEGRNEAAFRDALRQLLHYVNETNYLGDE